MVLWFSLQSQTLALKAQNHYSVSVAYNLKFIMLLDWGKLNRKWPTKIFYKHMWMHSTFIFVIMVKICSRCLLRGDKFILTWNIPHFSIPHNGMTKFVSLAGTAMKSICISSTLPNYYIRKVDVHLVHLLFHILHHYFIDFLGGDSMQNSTLILTEQRPSHDKSTTGAIIQQAITTWLTKELSKWSLRCVLAAQGFQIISCRIAAHVLRFKWAVMPWRRCNYPLCDLYTTE